jgi:Putative inner membrane exporter, YdcZ
MSPIWFTPFIIVAGALQAFGAVMSAQLRVSLTNPWLALTVLFTLNAFFFAGLFAILPRPCQRSTESALCRGGRRWLASPAR